MTTPQLAVQQIDRKNTTEAIAGSSCRKPIRTRVRTIPRPCPRSCPLPIPATHKRPDKKQNPSGPIKENNQTRANDESSKVNKINLLIIKTTTLKKHALHLPHRLQQVRGWLPEERGRGDGGVKGADRREVRLICARTALHSVRGKQTCVPPTSTSPLPPGLGF